MLTEENLCFKGKIIFQGKITQIITGLGCPIFVCVV